MEGRHTFEALRQLVAITALLARLLACLRACLLAASARLSGLGSSARDWDD